MCRIWTIVGGEEVSFKFFLSIILVCSIGASFGGEHPGNAQYRLSDPDPVPVPGVNDDIFVSLDQVSILVSQQNPRLKAARFLAEEAQGRLLASGKWRNPKLLGNYNSDSNGIETQGGVGFSQSFPLAGRLLKEKAVSESLLTAVQLEIADVEQRLVSEAKTLAVQVVGIKAQAALRQRQLILSQELSSFVGSLVKRGEASKLDAGQSKLDETQLELEVHHLDHEGKELLGRLKILLGVRPESQLHLQGNLPQPEVAAELSVDVSRRPDYQAAVNRAHAAKQEIRLAQANRWQDVTLGVFANRMREEDLPVGLQNEERIGVQVSVPLPLWRRNRGVVLEKRAAAARWEQTVIALENEILNEVVAARTVMNTLAVHADEIRDELLPEARQHVAAILAAYKNGLLDLQTVLRARSQAVEMESKYLTAIEDYHLARVRFETALGPERGEQ